MGPQTITAAGVLVYVNNLPMGTLTGLSYSSSTPRKAVYKIDAIDPVELMTTQTKTSVSLSLVKTLGDNGIEGQGMTTYYDALLREKYFSIKVIDRVAGFVLYSANYCSIQNQQWSMQARNIIQGSIQLEALDWTVGDLA